MGESNRSEGEIGQSKIEIIMPKPGEPAKSKRKKVVKKRAVKRKAVKLSSRGKAVKKKQRRSE